MLQQIRGLVMIMWLIWSYDWSRGFLPECVRIYVSECVSHFVVHWAGFPIGRQLKTEKVCETAIFVLITENSNLKKRLQEEERNHHGFGTVRCVERRGTTIEKFLHTIDPWAENCTRPDCFLCTTRKPGACMKKALTTTSCAWHVMSKEGEPTTLESLPEQVMTEVWNTWMHWEGGKKAIP